MFVDNTGSEKIILLATKWNIYYHWEEQNEFKHFTPGKKNVFFFTWASKRIGIGNLCVCKAPPKVTNSCGF